MSLHKKECKLVRRLRRGDKPSLSLLPGGQEAEQIRQVDVELAHEIGVVDKIDIEALQRDGEQHEQEAVIDQSEHGQHCVNSFEAMESMEINANQDLTELLLRLLNSPTLGDGKEAKGEGVADETDRHHG